MTIAARDRASWGTDANLARLAPTHCATESGFSRGCRAICNTALLLMVGLLMAFISIVCAMAAVGIPLLALGLYMGLIT